MGVGLAHSEGQLETARLGLGGPYLPFGGPERLVLSVGQSIGCLGHVRLCIELGSKWLVLHWRSGRGAWSLLLLGWMA